MPGDPLVDFLEKTFSDSYRKEVEQEENVWRTLPFFAATLALEVAALAPLRDWIIHATGKALIVIATLLGSVALATLVCLVLVVLSVWPSGYSRAVSEPDILAYISRLAQMNSHRVADAEESALLMGELKIRMIEDFAAAATDNRWINRRKLAYRTFAGLVAMISVTMVMAILALHVVMSLHG